jgi:hypothetical protein
VHGGNLFSYTSRYAFHTDTSLNGVNDIVPNHHDSPVRYVKEAGGSSRARNVLRTLDS